MKYLIVLVVVYLIGAFIRFDLAFWNWSNDSRAALVGLWLIGCMWTFVAGKMPK